MNIYFYSFGLQHPPECNFIDQHENCRTYVMRSMIFLIDWKIFEVLLHLRHFFSLSRKLICILNQSFFSWRSAMNDYFLIVEKETNSENIVMSLSSIFLCFWLAVWKFLFCNFKLGALIYDTTKRNYAFCITLVLIKTNHVDFANISWKNRKLVNTSIGNSDKNQ